MVGYQHILRAIVTDLEQQYGPEVAFPITSELAAAYEQLGKLYRSREANGEREEERV